MTQQDDAPDLAQEIQRQFALLQEEMKRVLTEPRAEHLAAPLELAPSDDSSAQLRRIELRLDELRRDTDSLRDSMADPAGTAALDALKARIDEVGTLCADLGRRLDETAAKLGRVTQWHRDGFEELSARIEELAARRPSRWRVPVAILLGAGIIAVAIQPNGLGGVQSLVDRVAALTGSPASTNGQAAGPTVAALSAPPTQASDAATAPPADSTSGPPSGSSAGPPPQPDTPPATVADTPAAPTPAPTADATPAPPAPVPASPSAADAAAANEPPTAAALPAAPPAAPPVAVADDAPAAAPTAAAPAPNTPPTPAAPPTPASQSVTASADAAQANAAQPNAAQPNTTDAPSPAPPSPAEASPSQPSAAAVAPVQPAPAAAAPAGIVLHAKADVWVQVRNRQGGVVLSRVLHAGETWPVPDQGALTLTTGNAGGLEVLVDGKPTPSLGAIGAVRRDVPLDPAVLQAGSFASRP